MRFLRLIEHRVPTRLLAAAVAVALPLGTLAAQQQRAIDPAIKEDPVTGKRVDLRPKKGFSLFGLGDLGLQGGRGTLDLGNGIVNFGLCGADGNQVLFPCPAVRQRDGVIRSGGFAYEFALTGSRSDFRKIRTLHPGVAEAVGGGYSGHYALAGSGFTGLFDFGPADNSAGRLFNPSTRTTVGDNSCRDKSSLLEANYFNDVGALSVLAGSDCPESWPATGFDGARIISEDVWANRFAASPAGFNFDFWRVPRETYQSAPTPGTFSTYYETSDYFSENVRDWGAVTPLASGRPRIGGFPYGIDLRVDAFVSAVPRLANAQFYQVMLINNSARVYGGAGVDYDSLYFGITQATLNAYGNQYDVPALGASVETAPGANANCNGARIRDGIFGACPTATTRGFFRGGKGVIVLKSPIGDLRNKLFTRAGSRFFNPAHPNRGDTITYNHAHRCGFGVCSGIVHDFSERSTYGYMSSREEDVLDGRQPSDLGDRGLWRVFHNMTAGNSTPAGEARFNRYLPPGGWDYDKDGVLDTLKLDTCGPNGCVPRWSDSLPGGQLNRLQATGTGQTTIAGPFKLRSRDTTAFVFAIVAARDSLPFEDILRNAIDYYLGFYASASPPPAPSITNADVPSAADRAAAGLAPFVRLALGPEAESWTDPFFIRFATEVSERQEFRAIRALNPGIADSIRARARANVSEILIFRSCDNGANWDADGDCDGDPSVDPQGRQIGVGWQAYAVLGPTTPGGRDFPNTFEDPNVQAGRTYLYSVVARSRGQRLLVRDSAGGREVVRELVVADTLSGTLATSGPSTRRVYVPVTVTAGRTPSSVSVTRLTGRGVSTAPVTVRLTANPVPGEYRLEFANKFTVIERTEQSGAISTTVIAADTLASCVRDGTTVAGCVVRADTFTVAERLPVADTVSGRAVTTTMQGTATIRTRVYPLLGFVALSGTRPLFVSTVLSPEFSTPADLLGSSLNPGFVVRVDNAATAATASALEAVITERGDTLNATILNNATLQLREGTGLTDRTTFATGLYEFQFRDDVFGPSVRGFRLDVANPAPLASALTASLTARARADTTTVDPALIAKLPTAALRNADYVTTYLPFRAVNATTGNRLLFAFARQSRDAGGIVFGNAADTLRVPVSDTVWVAGDALVAFEIVNRDQTNGSGVPIVGANGEVLQRVDTVPVFTTLTLGCNVPRTSCNPLVQLGAGNPGATGYRPYVNGEKLVVGFNRPFNFSSRLDLTVSAPVARALTATEKRNVQVVPNPYIVQSEYDVLDANRVGESRVLFTGLPARGTLRIYSVSGQFLQQLTWTESDLNGTGDLPYNLRTREGTELATGIYVFVVDGTTGSGGSEKIRGKFVVIR